jgi:hypothetical protein
MESKIERMTGELK